MAGHAPEFHSTAERLWQWLEDVSDYRLSVYMLASALLVALLFYLLESRVLV